MFNSIKRQMFNYTVFFHGQRCINLLKLFLKPFFFNKIIYQSALGYMKMQEAIGTL